MDAARLPPIEAAGRLGALDPVLAARAATSVRARSPNEAISEGAEQFSDRSEEVTEELLRQVRFLSDNPRTIKRAINLYRFYSFARSRAVRRRWGTRPPTPT